MTHAFLCAFLSAQLPFAYEVAIAALGLASVWVTCLLLTLRSQASLLPFSLPWVSASELHACQSNKLFGGRIIISGAPCVRVPRE